MKPKKRELHEMPFTKTVKSCLKLRPVLVDLELAPLTLRKLKDDNKTREIQQLRKLSRHPLPPPRPGDRGTLQDGARA